jgi:hypothetical protein
MVLHADDDFKYGSGVTSIKRMIKEMATENPSKH